MPATTEVLKEEITGAVSKAIIEVLDDETASFLLPGPNGKPDTQKGLKLHNVLKQYAAQYLDDLTCGGTKKQSLAQTRMNIATIISLNITAFNGNPQWAEEFSSSAALAEHFTRKLVTALEPKVEYIHRAYLSGVAR